MLAILAKTANFQKGRFWRNFAKVVDGMLRANKVTQLEGPKMLANLAKTANLAKVVILAKFFQGC